MWLFSHWNRWWERDLHWFTKVCAQTLLKNVLSLCMPLTTKKDLRHLFSLQIRSVRTYPKSSRTYTYTVLVFSNHICSLREFSGWKRENGRSFRFLEVNGLLLQPSNGWAELSWLEKTPFAHDALTVHLVSSAFPNINIMVRSLGAKSWFVG